MRTKRATLLLLATIVSVAAACSGPPGESVASPTPAGTSRPAAAIAGRATAGPVCPVEKDPPDPSCAPRPVSGAIVVVRSMAGAEVGRVSTAGDGTFLVEVPAGDYVVEGLPAAGLMGTPSPQNVTVAPGTPTRIELSYDTGIR